MLIGLAWPKEPVYAGAVGGSAKPPVMLAVKAKLAATGVRAQSVSAAPAATSGPPGNPANWLLTFSDEFNGTSLDRSKWQTKYAYDSGHGDRSNNDEQEWYVDDAQTVGSGILTITTKQGCLAINRAENYAPYDCALYPYTSGLISSQYSFAQKYGYFEARMKIPAGQGFWPAFWLLPQPSPLPLTSPWPDASVFWPPEVDIMENKGNATSTVYMTNLYSGDYPFPGSITNTWAFGGINTSNTQGDAIDYSQGFHSFGVDWEPDQLVWYIDGTARYTTTQYIPPGSFSPGKMYVLANLAVGGSFPGNADGTTVFPNTLQIDYIRVYQNLARIPYRAYTPFVSK
ncbi:MAG: glycoside hydrolase family 16 protein [Chloroflexi bacterium]|nr:glycoside hydrolase family 16 protein [Chloroflexota bacterium]MCL5275995.1 glycoside hydrolase family 16 protein [Chloroflexota bacterium]